ncbi:PL29 family lyase N-terminal domain-containing protein [Bacteroides uniformis]|uniref:PL29 family lyase N-terminal domain-containing protein n=1 Tax=Bacteroides uniformis TaxID=820 RepID=UPI003565F080
MNKKFLSAILFGALMVGSTSTFVSCKDYDDDIDGLQEQIDANKKQIDDILAAINGKKFIESYAPVEGGYLLTFTGGETLTIKNGAQGEKGEQGLQGIQGPKGETGATIVPKFKVDAENYWMISVDEGATYEYVLNDAGEKIKAAGSEANVEEAIGNYVKVDEEGYICIGEYKTSFKYNANVPSMIYNEKDGTMQVTIGGQSYTLLMEGSAFNGLQSIAFRKPYADNSTVGSSEVAKLDIYNWFKKADGSGWEYRKATREDEEYNSENWKNNPIFDPENSQEPFRLVDVVTGLGEKADVNAYQLYSYDKSAKEFKLFAAIPGVAEFKVWPNQYSQTDAEYFFSDSYKTRAVDTPVWSVKGTPELNNGILSVKMIAKENIVDGQMYMSSLDVTMYKQYTSSSDYFSIKSSRVNTDWIFAAHSHRAENGWPFDLPGAYDEKHPKKDSFIYNESYNLNDSINAYMSSLAGTPELSEIGLEYTQKFELLPNDTKFMLNGKEIKSKQGIFQINDGILSVKEQYQASAIYEYAAIKLTTTVKSQVEGVADYVFENTFPIQAIRKTEDPYTYDSIELVPNEGTLTMNYNASKETVIALNVRKFESEIGGRDLVAGNNNAAANHLLPLFIYDTKTKAYTQLSKTDGKAYMQNVGSALNSDNLNVGAGDIYLYYRNGGDNADKDSLFLVVGPKVELAETTLYVSPTAERVSDNQDVSVWNGGWKNGAPYAVDNYYDKKFFMLTLNKVSVNRTFAVSIKDAYNTRTIIGDWSDAANGNFGIKSENFAKMYNVTPADAKAVFELNKDKQNAFVQELMKNNQLVVEEGTNGEWRIAFTAPIDIKKVGNLKVDIYDANGYDATDKNRKPDAEELWTVARPIADFTGGAALKAFNDPNLAKDTEITLKQLIENSVAGTKTKAEDFWKNLILKDYAGETVVKFNGTTFNAEEVTARAALYKKSVKTGLRYIMSNGTDKDEYFKVDPTTGKLTCIALPTGTEFTHTVNVVLQFVHDWGTSEYAYNVTITRKQATR